MTSAADALRRAIARTQPKSQNQEVDDPFVRAIARKLEHRGIATVPGLPNPEPGPEPTWVDRAVELARRTRELEEEWAARRKAEAEAQNAAGGSFSPLPLNGAAVLRTALAGMGANGTVNGEPK